MQSSFSRNRDIFFAFVVLFCSAGSSFAIYERLFVSTAGGGTASMSFSRGSETFAVFYKGLCVGSLVVSFKKDELYEISSETKLKTVNSESPAVFSLRAFFNPLGQHLGGFLDMTLGKTSLHIRSKDVTPIEVAASLRTPVLSYDRVFSFPGPLLLEEEADGEFRIVYHGFEDFLRGRASSVFRTIAEKFPLSVARDTNCSKNAESELDPSELSRDLVRVLKPRL